MEIYFCDVCGARVTDSHLRRGNGIRVDDAIACSTCLEKGQCRELLAQARRRQLVQETPLAGAQILDEVRDRQRTVPADADDDQAARARVPTDRPKIVPVVVAPGEVTPILPAAEVLVADDAAATFAADESDDELPMPGTDQLMVPSSFEIIDVDDEPPAEVPDDGRDVEPSDSIDPDIARSIAPSQPMAAIRQSSAHFEEFSREEPANDEVPSASEAAPALAVSDESAVLADIRDDASLAEAAEDDVLFDDDDDDDEPAQEGSVAVDEEVAQLLGDDDTKSNSVLPVVDDGRSPASRQPVDREDVTDDLIESGDANDLDDEESEPEIDLSAKPSSDQTAIYDPEDEAAIRRRGPEREDPEPSSRAGQRRQRSDEHRANSAKSDRRRTTHDSNKASRRTRSATSSAKHQTAKTPSKGKRSTRKSGRAPASKAPPWWFFVGMAAIVMLCLGSYYGVRWYVAQRNRPVETVNLSGSLANQIKQAYRAVRDAIRSEDLAQLNAADALFWDMQANLEEYLDEMTTKGYSEERQGEQLRKWGYNDLKSLMKDLREKKYKIEQQQKNPQAL